MKKNQIDFINYAKEKFGTDVLTVSQLKEANANFGFKYAPQWLIKNANYKVGKSTFKLPDPSGELMVNTKILSDTIKTSQATQKPSLVPSQIEETADAPVIKQEAAYIVSSLVGNIVPKKDTTFVAFGNYTDVKSIVKSKQFYPVFITGLSGNGKTMGITQACAETNRELVRVNITIETDEDDLLGGYRLKDGDTVWQNGPVIEAMQRGAVLLLDEIDLASNKIMCLQPVLEGGDIFLKKINRLVKPLPGFNIIATANTKGKGSEDGRFIGTNILNEAFLDRFPLTFEQDYPNPSTEKKIITKILANYEVKDETFVDHLVQWTDVIRRTYDDGGIDEIISTRRLVNIVNSYMVFRDKMKAIEFSINRFDEDTKNGFMDLWSKVDPAATPETDEEPAEESKEEE